MKTFEIAEIIKDLTGSPSQIKFNPLPQDDPLRRCPDISLAKKSLNWEPVIQLEEGLKKTIAYFEDTLDKPTYNFKKRIISFD